MAFTWSRENRTGELFNNGTRTGIQVVKDIDQNKTIDLNPTNHPVFDIGLKRDAGTTLHGYLRDLMVITRAISDEEVKNIFAWSRN